MKIISHRGYWKSAEEKNLVPAFERSFSLGYGTETDVRDSNGRLLISHDMPRGDELSLDDVLRMASSHGAGGLTLALNIKADGLAQAVADAISRHPCLDCFAFDMSVPDMRGYLSAGVPVFTRMSEVERDPAWLKESAGVWLDSFIPEWYDLGLIRSLLSDGKRVCVVSSELHRRDPQGLWQLLRPLAAESNLVLCTDLPEDATMYFFGKQEA
ncbi:phosphodiesterase [Bordetella trematum]|uniref:phosphodiesterase n=1 Tax=Bordetella trematum TaxID=123899 RepID=UPI0013FD863A|nr:phosphodiesterase [Bordetella trematum]